MKNLATLLLCTGGLLLNAQEEVQKPKQNQIEIFYSVSDFLDGSPTNWLFLQRFNKGDGNNGLELPSTWGLKYSRSLNGSDQIQITAAGFYRDFYYRNSGSGFEATKRSFLRFSARYGH